MTRSFDGSRRQQERARRSLAGGVATAFRASQKPVPVCFVRGEGARVWDIDGNEYLDYVLGFGPLLLGHSPADVVTAVAEQLRTGLGYGASHPAEAELAEAVCRTVPSAERCVFGSTGSEAVHAALRIARAATGRRRVVKFLGHYHGWLDPVHVGVPGQSAATPGTGGQDPSSAQSLTVCRWNDLAALQDALADDVAAVIMEPLNVNGGTIAPEADFLAAAAELVRGAGALLVFDEVITGYRLALGGAQERYGVSPDLTVLGKALGAGFPISAVCGRADVLEVASDGRVAHVGTFNANPICARAAIASISSLEESAATTYPDLERRGRELAGGLRRLGEGTGIALRVNQVGPVLSLFVADEEVTSYEQTLLADDAAVRAVVADLLQEGVHVIPRGLMYVSTAHLDLDVAETLERAEAALHRQHARLAHAGADGVRDDTAAPR